MSTSTSTLRRVVRKSGLEIPPNSPRSPRQYPVHSLRLFTSRTQADTRCLQTLVMFLARIAFFRLHESPRYLVHAGRHQEAIESLQMISKFNGSELELDVEDVRDHLRPSEILANTASNTASQSPDRDVVFNADADEDEETRVSKDAARPPALASKGSRQVLRSSPESDLPDYSSTGAPNVSLSEHAFQSVDSALPADPDPEDDAYLKDSRRVSAASASTSSSSARVQQRHHSRKRSERRSTLYSKIPRVVRRPLYAWLDRVAMVLAPEWLRTTILVWIVWCAMSLGTFPTFYYYYVSLTLPAVLFDWVCVLSAAYTMFNVYLPKLLEGRGSADEGTAPKSLSDSLWDVVIYSIGGCPGAIVSNLSPRPHTESSC